MNAIFMSTLTLIDSYFWMNSDLLEIFVCDRESSGLSWAVCHDNSNLVTGSWLIWYRHYLLSMAKTIGKLVRKSYCFTSGHVFFR
jgi:hypothetical protein